MKTMTINNLPEFYTLTQQILEDLLYVTFSPLVAEMLGPWTIEAWRNERMKLYRDSWKYKRILKSMYRSPIFKEEPPIELV